MLLGDSTHPEQGRSGCRLSLTFLCALLLVAIVVTPTLSEAQQNAKLICVNGGKPVDCSNIPKLPKSDVVVQVVAKEHYSCTVDGQDVPCIEVGRHIRILHPSDDPNVKFCGAPNLDPSELSVVLGSISGENLPLAFGCARGMNW